jgi:hypothetical protein
MFGGMFYSCSQANLQQNGAAQLNQNPGITVGGTTLPAFYVQEQVERQVGQYLPMMMGQPNLAPSEKPAKEVETYGLIIDMVSNEAAHAALAQKNGADLSDEGLKKVAAKRVEDEIASERDRAVTSKELKENATEKEWEEFFKKKNNMTLAEARQKAAENFQKQLSDPNTRQALTIAYARPALEMALEQKLKMTDDEVRRANESVTYKQILFKAEIPGKTPAERAEAALKAIQSGTKFETAIDRYSNEVPAMNQKLSEKTLSASGSQTLSDPQYAPLATLKAGEVSGIVDVPEGKAIYKVVSRTPPPADFDKKKDTYRKAAVSARVNAEITKQMKELKDAPGGVVIKIPSYDLAYQYMRLTGGPMAGTPVVDPAKAKNLYEEATQAIQKGGDTNLRLSALVRYAALMKMKGDPTMTPDAFRKAEIEAVRSVLDYGSDFDLRMQLVDLLLQEKDNVGASEELVKARQEISTFDDTGVAQVRQVSAKRLQMKNDKTLTPEAEKEILAEQARWQKDKEETDKIAAEQKAEREKEEAAAKKAAEEAKKNAPAPTTGSTATTTGTPAPGTTAPGAPVPGVPVPGATTGQ